MLNRGVMPGLVPGIHVFKLGTIGTSATVVLWEETTS
jgi:hypothetical protein